MSQDYKFEMKILEIINLSLFTFLIIWIILKEILDMIYNYGVTFWQTIRQHYNNFWNIFDLILIIFSGGFIIVQFYCVFNQLEMQSDLVKIFFCVYNIIIFAK